MECERGSGMSETADAPASAATFQSQKSANHTYCEMAFSGRTPAAHAALSQPPKQVSHMERMLWLQHRRLVGLWVACDHCNKFRYLPHVHDPLQLPPKWHCHMNPDARYANCSEPEVALSVAQEEDLIHGSYAPGSVVWAKYPGYPWWPAMVDDDPDTEAFYWLNDFSDIPTYYNVVFFDALSKSAERGWVEPADMKPYEQAAINLTKSKYYKRLRDAQNEAIEALRIPVKERLAKYSFLVRYKGPIITPLSFEELFGNGECTINHSGKKKNAINKSGNKKETVGKSGKKKETVGKSREKKDATNKFGKMNDTINTSGKIKNNNYNSKKMNATISNSGKMNVTVRNSGKKNVAERNSGNKNVTVRNYGMMKYTINNSGKSNDTISHLGKMKDTVNNSGTAQDTFNHSENVPDTVNYLGNKKNSKNQGSILLNTNEIASEPSTVKTDTAQSLNRIVFHQVDNSVNITVCVNDSDGNEEDGKCHMLKSGGDAKEVLYKKNNNITLLGEKPATSKKNTENRKADKRTFRSSAAAVIKTTICHEEVKTIKNNTPKKIVPVFKKKLSVKSLKEKPKSTTSTCIVMLNSIDVKSKSIQRKHKSRKIISDITNASHEAANGLTNTDGGALIPTLESSNNILSVLQDMDCRSDDFDFDN